MSKYIWLYFIGMFCFSCEAQVIFILDRVPDDTPKDAKIYIAGNFNSWNPADLEFQLQKNQDGKYQIKLKNLPRDLEFKFTLGSWEKIEVSVDQEDIANHKISLKSQKELHFSIQNWKKYTQKQSTVSANVKILDKVFIIPTLNRQRRVWIYLPPTYTSSQKNYPVLYTHDGQNLFDASTAYTEEWKLDESLDQLFKDAQNPEIIVVGINNGGKHRMDEYSPWKHPKYGGGEGDAYVDFIVQDLKPYIDQNYRTKSDRLHTGMMGSSMGGLISFYAVLKYPEIFGKGAILSPSFWITEEVFELAEAFESQHQPKLYFLAGVKEGEIMTKPLERMYILLQEKNYPDTKITYAIIPEGEHKEWFWHQEFPRVYEFLFKN